MKTGAILAIALTAIVAVVGVFIVDFEQSDERAPPYFIVEGGAASEFDADVGIIEVRRDRLSVPRMEVNPPENGDMASN